MPVFNSEVKKKIAQNRKNEHGDICFLINHKFLYKISFKIISFLFLKLYCVTFFIQDLVDFLALMFFYKIDFCLKISYVPFFRCLLVLLSANSIFPGKICHFSLSIFLEYEKLII